MQERAGGDGRVASIAIVLGRLQGINKQFVFNAGAYFELFRYESLNTRIYIANHYGMDNSRPPKAK